MKYHHRKIQGLDRKLFVGFLATGLFLVLPAVNSAMPGDLDPAFGNGGIVVTPIANSPYHESPSSMLLQPDGKIVVSGLILVDDPWDVEASYLSFFLARYETTGKLDTSFGANGKIIGPLNANIDIAGQEIALQPDGKIIAVGTIWAEVPRFDVTRYNSDGTLDPSFGSGGKVVTSFDGVFQFARCVAVQPDGEIVVAGYSHLGGDNFAFATVRYHPNGMLDTSFGTGGKVVTPVGNNYVQVGSLLVQPDGKIVIVGGSGRENYFTLVRYRADGSLDPEFGSNGEVIHSLGNGPATFFDGLLQPDGKVVAAGRNNGRTTIIRYNANGSIDTNFAASGIFTTEIGVNSIVLQPNGSIDAFGDGNIANRTGFAIIRLNANGSLDTSFGTSGGSITPIGTKEASYAVAGAVQPDGKILAFGGTYASGSEDIAVIRYLGDSSVSHQTKFDFDGDGRADISVFRPSDRIWYLNKSTAGFSTTQFGLSTDTLTPADFDGDGKTDISVFRDGVWYWLNSSDGGFNTLQFGAPGDIPIPNDFTGDGRADLAIFRGGTWYTRDLANSQFDVRQFGVSTDKPAVGDYDGDGRSDYAVYRAGVWYLQQSTQGFAVTRFGELGDTPISADYDGDGKADLAVYRKGIWYLLESKTGFTAFEWGNSTDIPAPADYDGDGTTDAAVFRPSENNWYLRRSTLGFNVVRFGANGDRPVGKESFDSGCGGCRDHKDGF